VYLVVAKGTGNDGVSGIDCTSVVVPHDQSAASIAAVNAAAAAAVSYCDANGGKAPAGFVAVAVAPSVTQQCSHE
jgi:hypothetical protein